MGSLLHVGLEEERRLVLHSPACVHCVDMSTSPGSTREEGVLSREVPARGPQGARDVGVWDS